MTVKDENTKKDENGITEDVENGGTSDSMTTKDENGIKEDVAKAEKKRKSRGSKKVLKGDPPGLLSSRDLLATGKPQIVAQPKPIPQANKNKKSSMLDESDDPFAFREGKTLMWRNINMTLVRMKNAKSFCVLLCI
jgi:hypothetical protein